MQPSASPAREVEGTAPESDRAAGTATGRRGIRATRRKSIRRRVGALCNPGTGKRLQGPARGALGRSGRLAEAAISAAWRFEPHDPNGLPSCVSAVVTARQRACSARTGKIFDIAQACTVPQRRCETRSAWRMLLASRAGGIAMRENIARTLTRSACCCSIRRRRHPKRSMSR